MHAHGNGQVGTGYVGTGKWERDKWERVKWERASGSGLSGNIPTGARVLLMAQSAAASAVPAQMWQG